MTIDEYARQVGEEIRQSYNDKQRHRVEETFERAQKNLDSSNVSPGEQSRFWDLVRDEFYTGHLLFEKQEASELHRLLRDIEARLAAKQQASE